MNLICDVKEKENKLNWINKKLKFSRLNSIKWAMYNFNIIYFNIF